MYPRGRRLQIAPQYSSRAGTLRNCSKGGSANPSAIVRAVTGPIREPRQVPGPGNWGFDEIVQQQHQSVLRDETEQRAHDSGNQCKGSAIAST